MRFRISPVWWPLLGAAAPVLVPVLAKSAHGFYRGRRAAEALNQQRIEEAGRLDLPEIERLEITVVVDFRREEEFLGDAGVSYLIKTELGAILMDVGFGPERPALTHNAARLGLDANKIDALLVTHLHPDHMGGLTAVRKHRVALPGEITLRHGAPCFVPAPCEAPGMDVRVVDRPTRLPAGLASTGPLARMLCFTGLTEEHAVVANLKGKGLAVVTGCGHPTVPVLTAMARRMADAKVYAIVGGLHFPITQSRGAKFGIQFQQIIGTGKVWWQRIGDEDLDETIRAINASGAKRVLLSAHDTCDHALARFAKELDAQVDVLSAGATYSI